MVGSISSSHSWLLGYKILSIGSLLKPDEEERDEEGELGLVGDPRAAAANRGIQPQQG